MFERFVPPTDSRLKVIRNGRAVVRDWKIPKPVVLVDTREQTPFSFVGRHDNWIESERRATLKTGDYTVEGMEDLLTLERKSLPDLIQSLITSRERFLRECERMSTYRWRAIIIEATLEDLKTPYEQIPGLMTEAHPNGVCGTLDAIQAKWDIHIIMASRHRTLAIERAASYLSKVFTYWWLEKQGYGRTLIDSDGL